MKTVNVGLIIALNLGVDPPDVLKPSPCARKECWLPVDNNPPQKVIYTCINMLEYNNKYIINNPQLKKRNQPTKQTNIKPNKQTNQT